MKTLAILGAILVVLILLGCSCESAEQEERNHVCDTSLEKCVGILGSRHKEQCYQTYHACITGSNGR